jgi:hypothetical protein
MSHFSTTQAPVVQMSPGSTFKCTKRNCCDRRGGTVLARRNQLDALLLRTLGLMFAFLERSSVGVCMYVHVLHSGCSICAVTWDKHAGSITAGAA